MSIQTTDFDRSLELVRGELERFYRETTGEMLYRVELLGVQTRSFSTIAFLEVYTSARTERLVVKQIRQHPRNAAIVTEPDQALAEFSILKRLHTRLAGVENYSVPRPVLVIPEVDALVMEFVEGHLLAEDLRYLHYFANRACFRQLRERFYDCGRWLRWFQEQMGTRCAGRDALTRVVRRCEVELGRIQKLPKGYCASRLRDCVRKRIDRLLEELADEQILVGPWHSDFGPWNIFAGARGITVLDFFGWAEGPVILDILKMVLFLEMEKLRLANNAWRAAALQRSFLDGYGPIPRLPRSALILCEMMYRLNYVFGASTDRRKGTLANIQRRAVLRVPCFPWARR